jgi:RNA polymerase sigma factor (sigma-70 family)
MRIELNELPGEEFIDIRPDFDATLKSALPGTDDQSYEDFRLKFFLRVFHPTPLEETAWIDELATHPFYLKIQRRRIGRPAGRGDRERIRDLVQDAQAKFATRLSKNPTLGVQPEVYMKLPGFIKRHSRSIASDLRRQRARRERSAGSGDLGWIADPQPDDDLRARIEEFIETKLPPEERDVARLRWLLGCTVEETAATLGITVAQVKYRAKKARDMAKSEAARSVNEDWPESPPFTPRRQ